MKVFKRSVLIIFLCFFAAGAYISYSSGCLQDVQDKKVTGSNDTRNKYIIKVDYDRSKQTARASETITFLNSQKSPLNDIAIHLFANAYKNEASVPVIGSITNNFPNGFNPGYIKVSNVKVDGREVKYSIDSMIMDIKLNEPVKPGSSVSIGMDFELKIPVAKTRFGSYEGVTQFVYWYPILAVYDGGWQVRQYNRIGESNYSDAADYDVSITLPADEKVAATGDNMSEDIGAAHKSGYKTVKLSASGVRDFAWVCSKDFIVEETVTEGIRIKSYYLKKNEKTGSNADDYTARVLNYYNSIFGKYPYSTLSVVDTYLYGGGMEYPQLISLGQSLYESDQTLEHGIAHEVAHQWWYVAVGSDEYKNPWLDEGMAQYSAELYTAKYSADKQYLGKVMEGYRAGWKKDMPVTSPVNKFAQWNQYSTVSYKMGAAALDRLRSDIGDEKFFKVMSTYYQRYKFKNADTKAFVQVISDIAGNREAESFTGLLNAGAQAPQE